MFICLKLVAEYGTAIFALSSDGRMRLAHAQMREGWVVVEMRYQLNWNPGNIHAYTMELQAYTVRWSTNYMPPSVIDAPFLWSVRCQYFAQWSLSRNHLGNLSMLKCRGILLHGTRLLGTKWAMPFLYQLKCFCCNLKTLFTLWRIDFFFFFNFDVWAVYWCSDRSINSQEFTRFEIDAVPIKKSMTEYHHLINTQAYVLF